jgi:hypothetical protein
MLIRLRILVLPASLLLLLAIPLKGQSDCTPKLEQDSVKIWICKVSDMKYRAVKSTFLMKGRLQQIAAMILDIERMGAWNYKTISSRMLKKISDHELIYYTEIGAPVLTDNRDFVIHLTMKQDQKSKEITVDLVSMPDYLPPKKNVVRVPFSEARWTIRPIDRSTLQIDYYVEIDLGGSVPPWMVNVVAHRAPYETFLGMKSQIGKYKNSKVSFIKE